MFLFQQAAASPARSVFSLFRHLGAFGLFFLAIIDSAPIPTFGGPDILLVILVIAHRNPWYEYAAVTTAGSVIGAYLTFTLARKAGSAYLESKFKKTKVDALLGAFQKWGTGTLVVCTAVPLPLPTSFVFAAAGVLDYPRGRYIAIVALCRAVRYALIALLAESYGRQFIRIFRHPTEHWGWIAACIGAAAILAAGAVVFNRKLGGAPGKGPLPGHETSPSLQ